MVTKFLHYLNIYKLFTKFNYLRALEYRADFFLALIATSMHTAGYLLFMGAILNQVPSVAGWTFDRMLTLFAVNQIMIYLTWGTFRFSLSQFPDDIMKGAFDFILKQPINPRFNISFRRQGTDLPLPLIVAGGITLYAVRDISFNPINTFLFLFLFICGFIILYNLLFSMMSLVFWIIEGEDLMATVEETFSYSRYPMEIFPTPARAFFLLVIPVLLMIYLPVTALLDIFDWKLGLLTIIMVLVSFIISQKIWHAGLRRYSSASS